MKSYRTRRRLRLRRKHRSNHNEVELNMAAMLDMAFQLLAFFILTFQPSEIETQIAMRMPSEKPITQGSSVQIELNPPPKPDDFSIPLVVSVHSNPEGDAKRITVGQHEFNNESAEKLYASLNAELAKIFSEPGFDSINLMVEETLRYECLMQTVDVCTKQKLTTGETMTKISISTIQ